MYSTTTDESLRMSYRISRGEASVLTFEPYKSVLLPLWRFRTPSIATASSSALYDKFIAYDEENDFVGMDMCRKFIQMGMTRAKRYANYTGGRKYTRGCDGEQLEKSQGHKQKTEKEEASRIFKDVCVKCRTHEGYQRRKKKFIEEQKEWDREQKRMSRDSKRDNL